MYFVFQQSLIWEGSGSKIDPNGLIKSIKSKSEKRARKTLGAAGLGRTWILISE